MTSGAGPVRRLAVVVITRNRRAQLCTTLEHLSALPEQTAVVVVDNGSRDATPATIRAAFPGVEVVALPANLGAAARNLGVRMAGATYVAFADDDSWWLPGSLQRAADIMDRDPALAVLAARILVGPDARPDPTSEAMAAGPLGPQLSESSCGLRAVTGFLACGAVVRARAFLSIGGFDEGVMIGGEEQTVAWDLWAAGWRALYAPEVVAVHHPAPGPERHPRRALTTRNDLWAAWSRLPTRSAAAATAGLAKQAVADPAQARGAAQAVRGLRRPLARRAAIPARVDGARRRLSIAAG